MWNSGRQAEHPHAVEAPEGALGGTGGSTGRSIALWDVGQNCGPYKIGQVTKSRGCKQGLQCINGTCTPLAR